ncbi:unnamed protein product, partial [Adineta ricciae]
MYRINTHRAGVKKHYLTIENVNDGKSETFCYYEKETQTVNRTSLIFIHGFSSDKNTWLNTIKNIPHNFHCIAIDMPGHGETVGFSLEDLKADRVIDKLKLFFDVLGLTRPMCLIGTSMGGSIVAMFAAKYPSYVKMICLLAPVPPGGYCETDAIRQIRSGMYDIILPRTHEQFYTTADTFAMKKIHCRHLLASQYLKTKLSTIDQHKK